MVAPRFSKLVGVLGGSQAHTQLWAPQAAPGDGENVRRGPMAICYGLTVTWLQKTTLVPRATGKPATWWDTSHSHSRTAQRICTPPHVHFSHFLHREASKHARQAGRQTGRRRRGKVRGRRRVRRVRRVRSERAAGTGKASGCGLKTASRSMRLLLCCRTSSATAGTALGAGAPASPGHVKRGGEDAGSGAPGATRAAAGEDASAANEKGSSESSSSTPVVDAIAEPLGDKQKSAPDGSHSVSATAASGARGGDGGGRGGRGGVRLSARIPPLRRMPTITKPGAHTVHHSTHPAYPERFEVLETHWAIDHPGYAPVEFTHPVVFENDRTKKAGGWADPEDPASIMEELKARETYSAGASITKLEIVDGRPRNPIGRTGMSGRGLLGKWGPNFAADPLVTRVHPDSGKLQIVSIQRSDTMIWALPGGMVDDGEDAREALVREFQEEAGNVPEESKEKWHRVSEELFSNGTEVFCGYGECLFPPPPPPFFTSAPGVRTCLLVPQSSLDAQPPLRAAYLENKTRAPHSPRALHPSHASTAHTTSQSTIPGIRTTRG